MDTDDPHIEESSSSEPEDEWTFNDEQELHCGPKEREIAELKAGTRALDEWVLRQVDIVRNKELKIAKLHTGIRELNE